MNGVLEISTASVFLEEIRMERRSILSPSAIVVAVLIGIFVLLSLRRWSIDHARPTPRTVEIPHTIRQKFAELSEKSVELEPFAAIQHDSSIKAIAFSPMDASLIHKRSFRTFRIRLCCLESRSVADG